MRKISIQVFSVLALCLGVACSKSSASNPPGQTIGNPEPAGTRQKTAKKLTQLPRWAQTIPQSIPAPGDVATPPPSAAKTESGIASIVLEPATGNEKARPQDTAVASYAGWTTQGVLFDSSTFHEGQGGLVPKNVPLKGFAEALQMLSVGERRRFWIPTELAFGDKPKDPMQPPGGLTMDVKLLSIDRAPDPPPAPSDLREPPPDAIKTLSGLTYRVLEKGSGKTRPRGWDYVHIEFTGWTADGKVFDSSIPERKPRSLVVARAMLGLGEALEGMLVEEKRRLWLPAELGQGTEQVGDKPSGDLVLDVKLVKIIEGR